MSDCCYLCGLLINEDNKHKEHILQNALGGTLCPENILCIQCGEKLNKDIDIGFVRIFDSIASRLGIKKDRKNANSIDITLKDLCIHEFSIKKIEAYYKEGHIYPKRPFYEYNPQKKIALVFARKAQQNDAKNKLLKDIKAQESDLNIIYIDNLSEIGGIIEFPFSLDNNVFQRGLAKIAIGFATLKKIKRNDMPLVLDISDNSIKNKIPFSHYYPLCKLERLIEKHRHTLDPEYPYHSISLYTIIVNDKKHIVCFIELFSTFQCFIILNDDYFGEDFYFDYAQKLFKKPDFVVDDLCIRQKDMLLMASECNQSVDYLFDTSLTTEQKKRRIEHAYNQLKYDFCYEYHVERVIKNALRLRTKEACRNKNEIQFNEEFNDAFKNDADSMIHLLKIIRLYFSDDEFFFENYRRQFINDCNQLDNIFIKSIFLSKNDFSKIKEYCYMKFHNLHQFIHDKLSATND